MPSSALLAPAGVAPTQPTTRYVPPYSCLNFINFLSEYCTEQHLSPPVYETHKDGEAFTVKCFINGHDETQATDNVSSTAKREAARKVLTALKNENFEAHEIDEVMTLQHEIAYFHEKLRDKKGKTIEAFNSVQKDDGRTIFQHLTKTSAFHCVELVEDPSFHKQGELFVCSIPFNVCYRYLTQGQKQRRKMEVTGVYYQKKKAEKIAWNKLISKACALLSGLKPEPLLVN